MPLPVPRLVAIAVSAALAIAGTRAGGSQGRWLHWVFKPLTTVLVLGLLVPAPALSSAYGLAIAVGLVFSLAGDVFLMLPSDRFLGGLGSFLLAHVAYLAASTAAVGLLPRAWAAVAYLAAAGAFLAVLWPGVGARLRFPVLVYVAVLALMAAQAAGRAVVLGTPASVLAAAGAGAFVVSDATLAVDRFRRPFASAKAAVLATYWVAQTLLALSTRG